MKEFNPQVIEAMGAAPSQKLSRTSGAMKYVANSLAGIVALSYTAGVHPDFTKQAVSSAHTLAAATVVPAQEMGPSHPVATLSTSGKATAKLQKVMTASAKPSGYTPS